MTIEALQSLRDGGTLDELYQAGIITPKAYIMLEAVIKVKQLTSMGAKHGQAVREVAVLLRVTPKTIYQYLSTFSPK